MFVPQASFADESQLVCLIDRQSQSKKRNISIKAVRENIAQQGCKAGDILLVGWADNAIAHVCDSKQPIVEIANKNMMCTYVGFVRERRNPEYLRPCPGSGC